MGTRDQGSGEYYNRGRCTAENSLLHASHAHVCKIEKSIRVGLKIATTRLSDIQSCLMVKLVKPYENTLIPSSRSNPDSHCLAAVSAWRCLGLANPIARDRVYILQGIRPQQRLRDAHGAQ
jgi:hypothetical protein